MRLKISNIQTNQFNRIFILHIARFSVVAVNFCFALFLANPSSSPKQALGESATFTDK